MFFLDPSRGRHRRAVLRFRVTELSRQTARTTRAARKASQRTWARLTNGSGKVLAKTGSAFRRQVAVLAH